MCGMKLLMHSQTWTVESLKFGMDKHFRPTFYWAGDYLFMLGWKLIHVSKWGPWYISLPIYETNAALTIQLIK